MKILCAVPIENWARGHLVYLWKSAECGDFGAIICQFLAIKESDLNIFHNRMLIYDNKMVGEPNVSPHKQIIKDDNVKECSIVYHI